MFIYFKSIMYINYEIIFYISLLREVILTTSTSKKQKLCILNSNHLDLVNNV